MSRTKLGPVEAAFEPLEHSGDTFTGRVTYRMANAEWVQEFMAAPVDEEGLAREALAQGLRLEGWLDDERTWAKLSPAPGGSAG